MTDPFRKNNPEQTLLGLDIGGTKTAVVEGAIDARILQKTVTPTDAHLPFNRTFPRIAAMLKNAAQTARDAGREIIGVSLSLPGPLKIKEGVFLDPPNITGWHGVRIRDEAQNLFPDLPVFTEHDGNAGALAEFYFGAGKDVPELRHLIFLTCGTGMGGGLIVNGKIVHGATDTAGEIGHLRLAETGPRMFGKAGSWEGFAAGAGMVKLAQMRFSQRWSADLTIRELVEAMLADDRDALAVCNEAAEMTGKGIALLVDTLNPQMIVLGSLGVALGEKFIAPARRVLHAEALPQAAAACRIVPAALGEQIGDVAALMAGLCALGLVAHD